MHGGGNRIYGLITHNRLFVECEILVNYRELVVQGQGLEVRGQVLRQRLVNCSWRILEDKHWLPVR